MDWANQAVPAAAAGKPIPSSPASAPYTDWLSSRIEAAIAQARNIRSPTFGAPLPADGALPPNPDGRRTELQRRVMALELASVEWIRAAAPLAQLRLFVVRLKALLPAMARLAQVFYRLAEIPMAGITAVSIALDLDNGGLLNDLVSRLETVCTAKHQDARSALETRGRALSIAADQLSRDLRAEAADLQAEVERLRKLNEELKEHHTANDYLHGELNDLLANIRQLDADIRQLQASISQISGQISNLDGQISNLNQQRNNLSWSINNWKEVFHRERWCPKGNPWDICEHWDRKRAFEDARQGWSRQLEGIQRDLSSVQRQRGDLDRELKLDRDNLADTRNERAETQRVAAAKQTEVQRDDAALQQQAQVTLRELWKSRADKHGEASARDQALLTGLKGKLDAPIPPL